MYIPIIYIYVYVCICISFYIHILRIYMWCPHSGMCVGLCYPNYMYVYIYICIRLAVYVYMCIYICISYPSQILVWRAIKLLTSLHLVKCSGTPSCGASYTSFSWDSLGHHMGSSYSSKIWNSCGSFANYHLIIGRLPVIVY
jgi:hypothetical protein